VCSRLTTMEDIRYAFNEICSQLEDEPPRGQMEIDVPFTTKVPVNSGFREESDKSEYRTR